MGYFTYITSHPYLALAASFSTVAILLTWFLARLNRKWNRVFGKGAKDAAGALPEVLQRLMRTEQHLGGLEPRVRVLEQIGAIAVQKVGFMRFNPFEDTGGDQSFAVALLDRGNNGVVISSLYTREGVRIYAKEIQGGNSKHPLSDEEKAVLAQAMEP